MERERSSEDERPMDDLTYDVLTVLHAKAKAIDAYDDYLRDAADDDEIRAAFERIRRDDLEHVRVLKELLARRLDEELGYDEDYDDDDEEEDDEDDDAVPSRDATDPWSPRSGDATRAAPRGQVRGV